MSKVSKRSKWIWLTLAVAVGLAISTQVLQRVGKMDADALVRQASAAFARRDVKTAGELLDRVLAVEPRNASALVARGKLWSSIGEFESALADWRAVEGIDGNDPSRKLASEARRLEGEVQVSLHRAPAAERSLLESWELHKSDANFGALELLLRIYVLQMRRDETRYVLDVIESFRPLALEEMVLRADAGAPIVEEESAVMQLREFIASDPSDLASVVALARYLMSAEKFAEAEAELTSQASDVAKQSAIVGLKSLCQFRLGRFEEAAATMVARVEAGRVDYWWWMAAGELAERLQELSLAADCFGQACLSQPDSGYARYRYGLALQASGQTERSKTPLAAATSIDRLHQQTEVIMRLVNLSPKDFVEGLVQIARTLHELNSSREGAAWARLALQVDPSNADARELSLVPNAVDTQMDLAVSDSSAEVFERVQQRLAGYGNRNAPQTEVARTDGAAEWRLEDVHEAVQLDFQYFSGESGFKYLIEAMGGGISVLDFDNDGWPDCYFPQGCKFPFNERDFAYLDQLYRNLDGQRFAKVTSAARVVENGYSLGAATGDINNDGFTDVLVANFGRNRLFINMGDGSFVEASDQWGLTASEMSSSLALADFDGDGNLDLYVVNYVDEVRVCRDSLGNVSTCNPQNFTGVQDRLYQNSGDGVFVDVTRESGVLVADSKGLGVVAADFDDDGLMDIYVANDTTVNLMFKNLGGMRFEEVGLGSGTALSDEGKAQAGMGIAAGDFDGDLRTDLFVTNFYLESNNLFLNRGDMNFKDEAMKAKLSLPSKYVLGFGTQGEDIDLDGDLDLIVANGHIDDYSVRGDPWKMPTQLFRNLGDGTFQTVSSSVDEYFGGSYLGRGVASLDWNRDGLRDFVVVHQDRAAALLENQTQVKSGGLSVKLIGRKLNRDAIGARVFYEAGKGKRGREIRGGDGFCGTNDRAITIERLPPGTVIRVLWQPGSESLIRVAPGLVEMLVTEI